MQNGIFWQMLPRIPNDVPFYDDTSLPSCIISSNRNKACPHSQELLFSLFPPSLFTWADSPPVELKTPVEVEMNELFISFYPPSLSFFCTFIPPLSYPLLPAQGEQLQCWCHAVLDKYFREQDIHFSEGQMLESVAVGTWLWQVFGFFTKIMVGFLALSLHANTLSLRCVEGTAGLTCI